MVRAFRHVWFAGMYEFDLVLLLLQQMCVFLVIAWLMSKTRLFIPLMQVTVRLPHKLLCYVTFSIFCIMGTYFGLHIEDSIANTRAIGAVMGGLLGGPVVGGLVGLTGGLHRYSLGGMTALSCMVSTIVEGLLGGLVHSVLVKRGRPDKVFSPLTAGAITFVAELVQMMIILLIARPFQDALHLVQSIAAPMMVTNTVGAALFMRILLDKRAMFEKYTSAFSATALKVAASTEGILRQGFNEENSMKVAQVLIQEGKATISTAICTRDDIMIYLIGKGVESGLAFTIMESVRKGKGLRDEWIETMKEHGVPDWYIWSCKLIKYMFPKAHAAAYVMMAYRIAWYKVFQPLAYYAAYFSIRATAFSYEMMCMGKERLEYYMAEIRKKGDSASKKELDTLKDMRIVQEMYARGFEFVPIDLYTAKAQRFQIVDGKLMPSLATIDGLGDKAADAVVDAAKQGKFLSKDDFRDRTKVSKTVIDLMDDLKLFGDIPQSNQMSLFDFTG